MFSAALLPILLASQLAQTEIHKCVDEDGNIAFQQTPCPEPVESEPLLPTPPAEVQEEVPVVAAEPVAAAEPMPIAEPVSANQPKPAEVEACKMPLREAIDAIEAEMLRGYSADEADGYKQELRGLTEQMRACE